MKLKELFNLLKDATEQGANKALGKSRYFQEQHICKAEAYRLFGRGNIDRWIIEGLISLSKSQSGSRLCLDRKKLEAIAASSNRITYLPVAERQNSSFPNGL
ncbi:hypothetical protein [Pedobacter sp. ASV28]|uniref:hypothetical protein n=1 Tax=Pedobacter sp. ASV28 TaxID=2795123 RepID=UPI0018EA6005|nr:hypothetical protein [Pedobacter sp. ASV28]